MKKASMVSGAFIATAVALTFMGSAVAGDTRSSAAASSVKCVGANSCKGQSSCKSAQNDCKGQNSCKGKGFIETSTTQECTSKGGKPETSKM